MATIGELAINVVANVAGLATGLKKGAGLVKSFVGGFGGIGASLTGVLSLGAAVDAVGDAMQRIDDTASLAQRLGVSTADVTALGHAADQTNSSAETMNDSLDKLNRNLGQIRSGGGKAARETLQSLGLDADRIAKMNAAQAFAEIAERIRHLPTEGDKAAAAFTLMGRRGTELVSVLNLGKDGLSDLRQEAAELGILISDEEAERVKAANDAIDRLKKSLSGLTQELAIELAPAIEQVADSLTNAQIGSTLGDLVEQNVRNLQAITAFLEKHPILRTLAGGGVSQILNLAKGARPDFANFKTQAEGDAERDAERKRIVEDLGANRRADDASFEEFKSWAQKTGDTLRSEFESPFEKFERKWFDLRVLLDRGAIGQETYNRALAQYRRELADSNPLVQQARTLFENTRTPLEQFNAEAMRLEQLLQGNAIGIDLFNRGLAEARRRFAESDPRAKREAELKKRVDELNREDPLAAFRSGVAELFDLAQRGLSPAALQRRREELFGAARAGLPEIQEPQFAGAALAGTQEAFSAILRATAQNEQLGEARKQTAWLERIERAVIEAKRETTVAGPFA